MRTEEVANTLEQIGFTEKEASVYMALLSLGTATAYQIAQHCDVKKPTVYVILEDLRKKGLVLKVPHAKKALFAPRDITEYLQQQEEQLTSARKLIPMLHALGGKSRPGVYFFTGERGVAEAVNYKFDSMRGKTYHSFYGLLERSNKKVVTTYDTWDQKALDADISFNIIMPRSTRKIAETGLTSLSKAQGTGVNIKFLKKYMFPSDISFEIAGDFVRMSDGTNLISTIIDDRSTAEAMRAIFQIVWEKGE